MWGNCDKKGLLGLELRGRTVSGEWQNVDSEEGRDQEMTQMLRQLKEEFTIEEIEEMPPSLI